MKAILVKSGLENFRGNAALYKCEPPYDGNEYVIASTSSFFGVETYLFTSNENAEVLSWTELEGSARGVGLHEWVWSSIGYQVVQGE